jgi:hypothetical protein
MLAPLRGRETGSVRKLFHLASWTHLLASSVGEREDDKIPTGALLLWTSTRNGSSGVEQHHDGPARSSSHAAR